MFGRNESWAPGLEGIWFTRHWIYGEYDMYANVTWRANRGVFMQIAGVVFIVFITCPAMPCGATEEEFPGTIKKVPGDFPEETTLKYRVGAVKTGKRTAHFWLRINNPNAFEVKVIVCAMLNLKKPDVDDTDYCIEKIDTDNDGVPDTWKCEELTRERDDGPDSYHFGCKRLTIPAGGTVDAFDEVATFDSDVCDADGNSLLGTVYFDLLKDCPLDSCDDLKGARNFLSPTTPADHKDWANVWAGGKKYEDVTDGGFTLFEFPSGNWVTMRKDELDSYPARLVGTLTGARAGATLEIYFNDNLAHSVDVPPDPENPPCGGSDVAVDLLFSVPPGSEAHDAIVLIVSKPCDEVSEGEVVCFVADVLAEPEAPFYDPGDFMYGIGLFIIRDTMPPEILAVDVSQAGAQALGVHVEATDATTMATGATLVYRVGDGLDQEWPIPYDNPAEVDNVMFFDGVLAGLPVEEEITFHVNVFDDVGNMSSSVDEVITLQLEPVPTVSEWGVVVMTVLMFTVATVVIARRRAAA